jgi:hypothetical protein
MAIQKRCVKGYIRKTTLGRWWSYIFKILDLNVKLRWALVAHTCNPSNLGGWDWEDLGSRPAWANSLRAPSPK